MLMFDVLVTGTLKDRHERPLCANGRIAGVFLSTAGRIATVLAGLLRLPRAFLHRCRPVSIVALISRLRY